MTKLTNGHLVARDSVGVTRHGQDEDNVRGILNGHRNLPLTDLGRQQAQQLARRIRDRELVFDVVYASPLDRALETAAIVSTELGLAESIVHDDLIERNFGIMTGRPAADVEEMCAPDIIKTENVKMIYAAATNTPWRRVLTDSYFGNTDIIGPVRD